MKAILRTKDGIETIVNDHKIGRPDYVRHELPIRMGLSCSTPEGDELEETKLETRQYEDRGERVPVLEEV